MTGRLALEQAEQRRWQLRPDWAGARWFDDLVTNEFLSADEQHARQSAALRRMVAVAAQGIPYYRELFGKLGISPSDIPSAEDLTLLPLLGRFEVQDRTKDLLAPNLPPRQKPARWKRTSGTTGQPVRVLHSASSRAMFEYLKQRELRWFRFDPSGTLAAIRAAGDLPKYRDGTPLAEGESCRLPHWPQAGRFFFTGPFLGFRNSNPLEAQIAWLEENRPDYLLTQSAELEHLALGFQERPRLPNLKGVEAISQQLTPEMRRRIETTFGVPAHENYGLNEIGLVASRCPEGGRFHVHAEHCLVEIVNEAGKPCAAGETGRIVVTSLTNVAMPLLRYDADDLAEAVAGPCPCGRTLPAFGNITGRYRRIAGLPPGTWLYWRAAARTLDTMPPELSRTLRMYQLHQYRDGSFELRLVSRQPLPPAFEDCVRTAWNKVAGGGAPARLDIRVLDAIPAAKGSKFQSFTSDFTPPPGPAQPPGPRPEPPGAEP
ncbi:MAG: hypothetical protein WCF16_07225 [Alphaproteobacteria bacterium]